MAAVWLMVRVRLRTRWRSWLSLAVLAGLAGGLVIAVAAGARRTDAAYPALVAWSASPDALVAAGYERVPQVSESARITVYSVLGPAAIGLYAPADSRIPDEFWHRKLLAGRLADPGRPGEADISFTAAQAEHVTVGDRLCLRLLGASGKLVSFCFRVVGINAAPGDFPPQYGYGTDTVWATPAFAQAVRGRLASATVVAARLRHGAADLPAIERQAKKPGVGIVLAAYPYGPQAANTERSIHLQAVALWLLAGVLAVVGLLVFGQLLSRLTALESADFGVARALGITPAQLTAVGLARAVMIGAVGAVLAAGVATVTSPVFPVGLAAVAEPAPGFRADWVALVLGMTGVAAAVVACSAWPVVRAVRRQRTAAGFARRRSPTTLAKRMPPVTAVTGTRLVLHRGAGRTALPVRSTISAAAVAVAGLSAALVFGASLGHLLATPALYGVTWDAMVAYPQSGGSLQPALQTVAGDPLVARWSGEGDAPVDVDGVHVGAITTGPGPDGSLAAVPVDGTAPLRDDEIVLGQRTLAAIGRRIGQTVSVSLTGMSHRAVMRIVGTAIFPPLDDTLVLGTGAEVTVSGLHKIAPPGFSLPPFNSLLVKFRSGVSVPEAVAELTARANRAGPFVVTGPSTPADLVNFGQLQALPLVLGLSLGALALLTVSHLLLTSVRRHLRDLMVLRAIGFTGAQVRTTVCWMSVTLTALGLAVGVPAGLLAGRLAWRLFTAQLGIAPVVVAPVISVATLVAAGLALGIAVTVVPGITASRSLPAAVLRAELSSTSPAPTSSRRWQRTDHRSMQAPRRFEGTLSGIVLHGMQKVRGFDGPVMKLCTGHFLDRRAGLPWLMGVCDASFDEQGACPVITRPLSLNHVAYPTWDSAATYRFYTQVLRCEFIAAIQLDTVPSTGANTPYLHTFYRLQKGGCIAFFEVDDLDEPAPDGIPAWIRHLALDVASLEELSEWRDHFEAHGLNPVGIVDHDGVWESLYIFDPQGVRIELTVQNRSLGESDRESGLKTLAQWAVRHGQDFVAAKA